MKQPLENDSALKNVYQQCSKITVDRLEDCLFENDLAVLIIDKSGLIPTDVQLQDIWSKVYVEFCQVSQGNSYNELFEIRKEIDNLDSKLRIVSLIIDHLYNISYSVDLVKILNNMGLQCDLKPQHSGTALVTKLNAVIGRSKSWSVTRKQRQLDFDRLQKKDTKKMERTYFDDQLMEMSAYSGYFIKKTEITVLQFFRTLNKMFEENQRQEAKKL